MNNFFLLVFLELPQSERERKSLWEKWERCAWRAKFYTNAKSRLRLRSGSDQKLHFNIQVLPLWMLAFLSAWEWMKALFNSLLSQFGYNITFFCLWKKLMAKLLRLCYICRKAQRPHGDGLWISVLFGFLKEQRGEQSCRRDGKLSWLAGTLFTKFVEIL